MDNDLSTKLSEATREIERLKEIIFQMDGILSIHGVVYKDISPERVKELIRLCHPDLHGGSELATKTTQWLLNMRGKG